jgi:hypothetical protein
MHKIILLGATAVILTLGSANVYAMGMGSGGAGSSSPLSPEASPYAILEPQTVMRSGVSEGRASYSGNGAAYAPTATFHRLRPMR